MRCCATSSELKMRERDDDGARLKGTPRDGAAVAFFLPPPHPRLVFVRPSIILSHPTQSHQAHAPPSFSSNPTPHPTHLPSLLPSHNLQLKSNGSRPSVPLCSGRPPRQCRSGRRETQYWISVSWMPFERRVRGVEGWGTRRDVLAGIGIGGDSAGAGKGRQKGDGGIS